MLHVVLDFLVLELATNQPLEAEHGIRGVDDCLPLGRKADKALPMFREGDNRRCCPGTLRVLDDA